MSEYMIELKNVSKKFPGVLALDNVRFDLKPGEVHVLLGENGAGKSTLIKILSGLYTATSGEIYVDGKLRNFSGPKDADEAGIATIYQELNLCENLNIAENIFLGRLPRTAGLVDRKKLHQMAQEELQKLNLDYDTHTIVGSLGVAQKQMVEIVKAVSRNTRILIMDEPTAVLTEREIDELFEVVHLLKAKGVGIIYISHRLQELAEIADRITVLRDGCYIETCEMGDKDLDALVRLMVGRDISAKFPPRNSQIGDVIFRAENISTSDKLSNVSFELRAGEIVGLAGLVGSGRTELARAIFGADKRSGGRIYVDGKEVEMTSPKAAIQNGLGFLTEERKADGLILISSIAENVVLASHQQLKKGPVADLKRQAQVTEEYVQKIRIKTPSIKQRAVNLSGGNQQKVILAKWMCANARIVIFDEPTRGIDVGAKTEVYNLMNQMVSEGACILMISSELPEIIGMSDRVLVMHEGTISGEVRKEDISQERILSLALAHTQESA